MTAPAGDSSQVFDFFGMSLELRDEIYNQLYYQGKTVQEYQGWVSYTTRRSIPGLRLVCRQFADEYAKRALSHNELRISDLLVSDICGKDLSYPIQRGSESTRLDIDAVCSRRGLLSDDPDDDDEGCEAEMHLKWIFGAIMTISTTFNTGVSTLLVSFHSRNAVGVDADETVHT